MKIAKLTTSELYDNYVLVKTNFLKQNDSVRARILDKALAFNHPWYGVSFKDRLPKYTYLLSLPLMNEAEFASLIYKGHMGNEQQT